MSCENTRFRELISKLPWRRVGYVLAALLVVVALSFVVVLLAYCIAIGELPLSQ